MPLPRLAALRALWLSLLGAFVFRAGCYAAMTALALWRELRPAPTLPDVVIAAVPYVPAVDRLNYLAWLVLYAPLSVALLVGEPRRWQRYMVTGGVISLARGVCIALTGLGVPDPAHAGPGSVGRAFLPTYLELISPLGVFQRGAARAYLTKDLFFSGHTATTFLLVLYLWHRPRLRLAALLAHVLVVASVLLSHLHYSIDVLGAWAFTFALYAAREWAPRRSGPGAR
jgi:hypothetical protein